MNFIKNIILHSVLILTLMCLFNIPKAYALTEVFDNQNISFNGAYRNYFYIGASASTTYNIQITFMVPDFETAMILDVCSGVDLATNDNFYRTYKVGEACSTSCFSNQIIRLKTGAKCISTTGYQGDSYRLYVPISLLDVGAGCGQTGCHFTIDDKLSFKNPATWWSFIDIQRAYYTDEPLPVVDSTDSEELAVSLNNINSQINTLNSSIGGVSSSIANASASLHSDNIQTQVYITDVNASINNQTNQQHTDAQNTQNAINNQTNQQHTDAQNTQNAINNVNSSINNDSVDSVDSKANEWSSKNLSDNAISGLLTLPINLITAFNNNINGTCSSFSLGTLFGHELIMPCVNISSYFGTTLWSVIDVLFSGFMILAISKKFVKIFNDFTNLKDTQVDELYGGGA